MTDSIFPSDFFEGEYYEKKGRKPRFLNKYAKQRFLPYLRIPVEYTVIFGIAILVLMVVSYAAGVEMGKRSLAKTDEGIVQINTDKRLVTVTPDEVMPEVYEQLQEDENNDDPEAVEDIEPEKALGTEEQKGVTVEEQQKEPVPGQYIVQLASFKKENVARSEVENLKASGIEAEYAKKGRWFQVYAEGYATINQAREAEKTFREKYPDCYIKKQQ